MTSAIETIGLKKYFSKFCALADIDLHVPKGQLFGLVGPNGAGKTTLLRILSTLILPTSGRCLINGYDLSNDRDMTDIKRSINFVSDEERTFYWRLTGRQNLYFFASLYDIPSRLIRQRIEEAAWLLEIEDKLDSMFKDYSSGIKQKLAIARSLLNRPQLILMDEPTKNLDVKIKKKLYSFMKSELIAGGGMTILMSSHQLDEIAQVCDRIAIIDKGRVIAQGTLNELRQSEKFIVSSEAGNASLDEIFVAMT